jgi:hypothetical protein
MEFCSHCRAPRKTRKSTRTTNVRREGTTRRLRIDSYHCIMCNHFIRSEETDVTPAGAGTPPSS